MKIKTLYIRFYKSFNYDYLRKSHPGATPDPWDVIPETELFFPFVRVPLEAGITTVVGANESGKSQLLGAVKCLLTGEGIVQRDFCRYSTFFSVGEEMKVPEFGAEFADLTEAELDTVRSVVGLQGSEDVESFCLFRTNAGVFLYTDTGSGWKESKLKAAELRKLSLPTYFSIDAQTPLPDSVPLAYLTSTATAKRARPRHKVLAWIERLLDNPDWFATAEKFDAAKQGALGTHPEADLSDDPAHELLLEQLALAEKLLIQVAGIGPKAFEELQEAVKNHDGYANAIVAKMNHQLDDALNFPKWWSQDSQFSLALTLRDFDLVFTVRDRTGSEYAFSERSGGLSYFLSYFVQYLSHRPSGDQEVLLMDEPDAYLSMTGQQDLLQIFDAFAQPDDPTTTPVQVLYVTHSPFLIDKNHSERIRVLEKGDGEEGTRLVANAGRNHYEPLRSAFGAFVAETTFIGNCNLLLEGQADQVLLAGVSTFARRSGSLGETLDLNRLSLVPSGSAEHIPYMVYVARGRDVDKPAVVVLLDGDGEADRVAEELRSGYRGRRFIEDDFIVQTSRLDTTEVDVATDVVRELEDLIPAELAVLAVHRFAEEVLDGATAESVKSEFSTLEVPDGKKLFKAAEAACAALSTPVRLDKVGFARATLTALAQDANPELRSTTLGNFEKLFGLITTAQRGAIRKNERERTSRMVSRFRKAFVRDHPAASTRREVDNLLEDIEGQLTEVTDETEAMRSEIRLIRKDYSLADEPALTVDNFDDLLDRLNRLTYEGVRSVQTDNS